MERGTHKYYCNQKSLKYLGICILAEINECSNIEKRKTEK